MLYIDGFAGPGIYNGGEEGSPIIALKEAILHTAKIKSEVVFIFIEAESDRHQVLKQQVETLSIPSNMKFNCIHGRFDEHLTQVLDYVGEQKKTLAPTFAFVDPFGFSHTPFSLISRLMQNRSCEVLITFMYEEINRFLAHPDLPDRYDVLFGCTEWRDGIKISGSQERKQFIHDLYMKQLTATARIKHVRSFEMLNDGNRTDYFLFFGTNNYEGLKQMKSALWKADELGGFQFSDTTDITQSLLFQAVPDYADLKQRICQKFQGRQVRVDDLEKFIVIETPYRETHYKANVLRPMELSSPPELEIIHRTRQNRRGTFHSGTMIKIL